MRRASGDVGGVGRGFGLSREKRLVVATDSPASCRDRMRSAMLAPDLCSAPLVLIINKLEYDQLCRRKNSRTMVLAACRVPRAWQSTHLPVASNYFLRAA